MEAEDDRGWSSLLVAAEKGDAEAVQSELAAGADINQADEGGWSALHLAALNAHTATVEALTGVDIIKTLKNLPQMRASEPAADAPNEAPG